MLSVTEWMMRQKGKKMMSDLQMATKVNQRMMTIPPNRVFREWWECSHCKTNVQNDDNYCRRCGYEFVVSGSPSAAHQMTRPLTEYDLSQLREGM
jgi:predicted amidophosphoribosyltransferase